MNEWVSVWMSVWMNEWMNEWAYEWAYEWMNEWMNEWAYEWAYEWMNEQSSLVGGAPRFAAEERRRLARPDQRRHPRTRRQPAMISMSTSTLKSTTWCERWRDALIRKADCCREWKKRSSCLIIWMFSSFRSLQAVLALRASSSSSSSSRRIFISFPRRLRNAAHSTKMFHTFYTIQLSYFMKFIIRFNAFELPKRLQLYIRQRAHSQFIHDRGLFFLSNSTTQRYAMTVGFA